MTRDARSRDRGAVLPIVALVLPVLIIMTAFAVDLGRQRADRREMQAGADVIALDMVRAIDERTAYDVATDPDTQVALSASADRNGFVNATLSPVTTGARVTQIEWGTLDSNNEFQPLDPFDPVQGTIVPDAVRITTEETTDYFFQPGSGDVVRTAVAQARTGDEAYFQVGSYLASISPTSNTAIGAVLSQFVPGAELLSYDGLVDADVTLGDLQAGLTAISPDTGLDTPISYQDLLIASIDALEREGGNTAAIQLLEGMVQSASTVDQFTLGDLVSAQAGGGTPAASATYDVLGLLTGAAFLVDGRHAISIPSTQFNILGLGQVDMALNVIEGPQIGGPNVGDTASTGQLDLTLTPDIAVTGSGVTADLCDLSAEGRNILGQLLGGILNFATCLLGGSINRVVDLQLTFDGDISLRGAGADAVLQAIDCESVPPSITVAPNPVPLELLSDLELRLTATVGGQSIGEVAVVRFQAGATSYGTAPPQTFEYPDQFGPPARRVGSDPLGLSGLITVTPTETTVLNTPLTPIIQPALVPMTNTLNTLLGQLDQQVLGPIAQALELTVGGADLTALSLACDQVHPRLVG